jgi:hypothetical protein
MPSLRIPRLHAIVTYAGDYMPGDPPPEGYLEWHEWAAVQHRAGLRQQQCCDCSQWRYPHELSTQPVEFVVFTARGKRVRLSEWRCVKCAERKEAARDE